MNTLRIYFPASWRDISMSCHWALCSDSGVLLQQGHAPLASMPKADDCVAIIPAERVLCTGVALPEGSRRRWLAALPFIAEEHTLPDPEENHVVPEKSRDDGTLPLLVVDKHWLRAIVDACRNTGIALRCAMPEMLLPAMPAEGGCVLVWDGSSGFVRTGHAAGAALDIGNELEAPITLHLALAAREGSPPKTMEVRFPHQIDAAAQKLPQWQNLPANLVMGQSWDWRREPISREAPNLLWGELAPRAKFSEWLPGLRPLALILLLALSIEIAGRHIEWALLANERDELNSHMTGIFHQTFGDSSAVTNGPLQMQRSLAGLRHAAGLADDSDFINLLDSASSALASLPAGSLRALNYDAGRLEVNLRLGKADELKSLQQKLKNSGLDVSIGKVGDTGNAAEAKLLLRPETGR